MGMITLLLPLKSNFKIHKFELIFEKNITIFNYHSTYIYYSFRLTNDVKR